MSRKDIAREAILKVLNHFWDLYDRGEIDRARLELILNNAIGGKP